MSKASVRQLWVHRLSVNEGGSPSAAVSRADCDPLRVYTEILKPAPARLQGDPVGAREFLLRELRDGRLRQGWGYPGLDLRKLAFTDNYVVTMRRYWNRIPQETLDALVREGGNEEGLFKILASFYREARGRFKILAHMLEMNRGDVVFIPNVPDTGAAFTVARIDDTGYQFDDYAGRNATRSWELDFGHRRQVRDVEQFTFSPTTLPSEVFSAPYRHAIDRVTARLEVFQSFLAKHYDQ